MERLREAALTVLVVCLLVRLAAWLVTPALPLLLTTAGLAYVTYLIVQRR